VLLCVTGGFQGFDLFFVLTNGGPYGATEIPTTYLVKTVFRNGEVGYGSRWRSSSRRSSSASGSRTRGSPAPARAAREAGHRSRARRPPPSSSARAPGRRRMSAPASRRGCSSARAAPARARVLLPDDLDGDVVVQDELGHLLGAVLAAEIDRLLEVGRGLGRSAISGSTRSTRRSSRSRRSC
jgi:hypothetical protein